ncbi:VOC family protein [Streptomyces sp. NPDC087294]|uniref:VOC family protein n=1 Tax=Streptomyces sp. NPDC087294 TaxID=3365777 RepID=UPI0037F4D720
MATDGFTTCLWYDGQAEEAAEFYVSIFKDSRITRITHSTESGPGPVGSVLTVEFTLFGQRFVGLNGGPQFTFDEAISFQVPCADQAEIDHHWDRLMADGGRPLACGWVKDRYGLCWQIVPEMLVGLLTDPDPKKAARAMEAMLATAGKFDIATLERAHAGG